MKILETEDIKYNLIDRIGNGGTCSVYKGYPLEDPSTLYAIKIFKEQNKKFFDKEISIHYMLEDINLFLSLKKSGIGYIHYQPYVSLFNNNNEMEQCDKVFYEIEEIAENGELFKYVYELNKGFNEQICAKIFLNIVKSVNLLHKRGIIHGDIKPENILIGNDFNIKLIDFGFSEKVRKNDYIINSSLGSDTYCSPEIRKAHIQGYDGIKSDIFSLGVLLFVIRAGKFPFNVSGYVDKRYRLIMTKNYELYWKGFEKDNFSEEFKDLINHLICYDPAERFTIEEILEHPWIIKNTNYSEGDIKNEETNEFRSFVDEDVIEELKFRRNYIENKIR